LTEKHQMKKTKLARLLLWAAKQDMSKKKGKVEKNTESEKFRRSVSQYSVMVPNNNWRAFFILSHVATQSKLLQCYYYILRIVLLCTVHRWIQNLSFFKSFIILLPRGFIMSFLRSGHTHLHFKCTVFILWISMNQYVSQNYFISFAIQYYVPYLFSTIFLTFTL
jgi:hypothetical protein